jgi:anti-sigma factor RsiW
MKPGLHNIAAGLHDRLMDGELEAEGRRWLAQHRAACARCDREFAEMERLAVTLGALERPAPQAGFADRVLAQVRPAPIPAWARWVPAGVWSRAAAIAGLILGSAAALAAAFVALPVIGDPANVSVLVGAPAAAAKALAAILGQLAAFDAPATTGGAVGGALLHALASPQLAAASAGAALLAAAAFRPFARLTAGASGGARP